MMKFSLPLSALVGLFVTSAAMAAPITPTYNTFGPLAGATFGGTGIPNNPVAITTVGGLTLGLAASQRFVGPNLGHDGAGTYTAPAGVSQAAPSPADPYAMWNFNIYIGGVVNGLSFRIFYDFDPTVGNDESTHGTIDIASTSLLSNPSQASWNLGMNFLAAAATGITPPAGVFDPNRTGQYTFALVAYTTGGPEIGRSAIAVNVPEPGTMALVGLALLGIAATRRRA